MDFFNKTLDPVIALTAIGSNKPQIETIYTLSDQENYAAASELVDDLIEVYPLRLPGILPVDTDPYLKLHQQLCAACHDNPNKDVERPAYNLCEQYKSVGQREMFARLLVGVRGDRVTGIDNPLSDLQLMGLLQLYSKLP